MQEVKQVLARDTVDLTGRRIVVVEDDYLLAADLCRELRRLGATVLGPAPTPFYAMCLIGRGKIDAAVLDVHLHGADVFEVADTLRARGVPIVFATVDERDSLPARFRNTPLLSKPFELDDLAAMLKGLKRQPAVAAVTQAASPAQRNRTRLHPVVRLARVIGQNLLNPDTR